MALALLVALPGFAHAQESACIYFFYGDGCPHCARVEPFISQLAYTGVEVHRFEIYNNRSNLLLLNQYFEAYGVPEPRGIPAVFIAGKYLVGDTPILENLENEMASSPGSGCPVLNAINASGQSGSSSPPGKAWGALPPDSHRCCPC